MWPDINVPYCQVITMALRNPWITFWSGAQKEPHQEVQDAAWFPPINPFGVWSRKTRISHGILQCQAFSNDFVSNVKPSSKITIKSMLMYEICGFCSCCVVGTFSKTLSLCLSGNGKSFLKHITMLTVTVYEDVLIAYQSHVYVIAIMVLNAIFISCITYRVTRWYSC